MIDAMQGSKALLLEDDPDLADAITHVLEAEGCEVEATPSGREAILLGAREHFDVVLADLQVEELSGRAAWQVLGDLAASPVVAMSASREPWEQDAFRAGVSACLPKPFDADGLASLVRALVLRGEVHDGIPGDVEELSDEDLARLRAMEEDELDRLPFGLMRVDDEGRIIGFNAYEASASGLAPGAVLGRKLSDIAPCTKVKRFAETLGDVRGRPGHSRVLRFRFPRRRAEALVSVRAFYDEDTASLWLFISKRCGQPAAHLPDSAPAPRAR